MSDAPRHPRVLALSPAEGPPSRFFLAVLIGVFSIAEFVKIMNHVMWRDEWRAWMICRESPSLAVLGDNLRFEGHPRLWYLCLYALNRLTDDPVATKLVHWAFAVAVIAVV